MYTIQQVAHEIEQLKPNLTEFLAKLTSNSSSDIKVEIVNEPNLFIKLLKVELYIMYHNTHSNRHYYGAGALEQILNDNVSNHGIGQQGTYRNTFKYIVSDSFDTTCHILAHIKDPKPYLPKYLWDKVRTVKSLNKEPVKQLQPDAMSLHVFKAYLQNRKNLTSVEAIFYLEQLKDLSFDLIREDFMDAIFSKCPKPSIDLQKNLAGQIWNSKLFMLPDQNSSTLHKYMALSRHHVKNLANKLDVPITTSVYDTLDSCLQAFYNWVIQNSRH